MAESAKKMAIIRDLDWTPNDERLPGLLLRVAASESDEVLLGVPTDQVFEFVRAYGLVTNQGLKFDDLKGKPVWINSDGRTATLEGPCVI